MFEKVLFNNEHQRRAPAARSIASKILIYPVQRHKFPAIASLISSRVGCGLESSRERAEISMPGVQTPHCAAPHSRNACCNGSRRPFSARPSTVSTLAPCAWQTGASQELITSPSMIPEQAPPPPSPQPSFVPVKRSASRKTSSNRFIGGEPTSRSTPLI